MTDNLKDPDILADKIKELDRVLDMVAECFDIPFWQHEDIGQWAKARREARGNG